MAAAATLNNPEGIARHCATPCKPDVIVNAAAHTAVDKARERARAGSDLLNATTPRALALARAGGRPGRAGWCTIQHRLCVRRQRHPSPGLKPPPPRPLSVYGQTKLEGEQLIAADCERHLIFRTSWVYAARGGNFAKTMLRLAKERDRLTVIDDQHGAPTGAELIADVTAHAVRQVMRSTAGRGHLPPGRRRRNHLERLCALLCSIRPAISSPGWL